MPSARRIARRAVQRDIATAGLRRSRRRLHTAAAVVGGDVGFGAAAGWVANHTGVDVVPDSVQSISPSGPAMTGQFIICVVNASPFTTYQDAVAESRE